MRHMIKDPKIIIVDHDVLFADRLISYLKRTPMRISWLKNAKDTMDRIEDISPHIVVYNVNSPGANPFLMLDQIIRSYPMIEVIPLTDQYLPNVEELVHKINHFLGRGKKEYLQ